MANPFRDEGGQATSNPFRDDDQVRFARVLLSESGAKLVPWQDAGGAYGGGAYGGSSGAYGGNDSVRLSYRTLAAAFHDGPLV